MKRFGIRVRPHCAVQRAGISSLPNLAIPAVGDRVAGEFRSAVVKVRVAMASRWA